MWDTELHRVKGKVLNLLDTRDNGSAAAYFEKALQIARDQSAQVLELRAATGLAELWRNQGKPGQARGMLAPIYDAFAEGFETPDLQAAKALLDSFSGNL